MLNFVQSFESINEYYKRPVFSVKIGMCSNECENVDFETALQVMDKLKAFHDTSKMEFAYIYISDVIDSAILEKLEAALNTFNLGRARK